MHDKIKKAMTPGKFYSFPELMQEAFPHVFVTSGQYLKAWQDLKVNGSLQEGVNGKFRINQ